MGLLDSMLGSALSNAPSSDGALSGSLAGALGGLLSSEASMGGLGGLVSRFQQSGMGDVVGSWIGKGKNLPISAEQVSGVLGSDAVAGIAAKLGIDPAQASQALSQILPGLIDKLTPHGHLPAAAGVDGPPAAGGSGDLMGMLGGLLQPR